MILAVLTNEELKQELLEKKIPNSVTVVWADSVRALTIAEADAYIDLLYEQNHERTQVLKQLLPKPVLVNAVSYSTKQIGAPFIRINGWPTMLQRKITEIAIPPSMQEADIKNIFDALQWTYQLVPDMPGMIAARVIAMIVNEAYYTLGAQVSTRDEIDTAMKLGTSYPYGPFEWSRRIGLQRIYELLKALSVTDARYAVAPVLEEEVRSMK